MAYGLKYTYSFKQIKNYTTEDWQLKIYLEGYGGSSSEITAIQRNSIKLTRGGDILDNVLGTDLSFAIYNQTEAEYGEFRTAGWGDYKVELIKDPTGTPITKFVGYNQSEIFTEPYNQPPYTSVVKFTCGLNHLKYVRFDDSGTLYEGQKTIIEVLRLCLNQLPSPLSIREFVNLYEDSISSGTGDSMMNQIYVDSSVYKEVEDKDDENTEVGFFCWDVINEILKPFNAHIYISEGKWFIFRPQDYQASTIYYREFNANVGSESTVTIDFIGSLTTNTKTVTGADNGNAAELILQAQSSELSIDPPLNRVKVSYDMDSLDVEDSNIIKNGCFEIRDTTQVSSNYYLSPSFWDETGNDSATYNAFYSLNIGDEEFFQFEPTTQATQTAINTSIYIEQTKSGIPTATTDSLQLSFDFIFRGNATIASGGNMNNSPSQFFYGSLEFVWQMEVKFGTYYLSGDATNGYSWTPLASRATFKKQGFQDMGVVRSLYNFYQTFTIEQTLPTLPENGIRDFSIKIYKPYSNWASYAATNTDYNFTFTALGQKCFKVLYLPNEAPPPSELILYSKIQEDEKIEEINCMHGDGLSTNTLNSFRLSTGAITDVWARRGVVESQSILNLLLLQLRDLRGDFTKLLNGSLIGEFEPYNTIEETTGINTEYWIKNYEYAIETNEWDVELFELADHSAISLAVTNETGVKPSGVDTDTTTAPIANDPNVGSRMVGGDESPLQSSQQNINNYP